MKKILLILLSLILISCTQSIFKGTGQYSDLDQEYSQFKTKALTQSYLKKKMDKWLSSPTYSKNLVREIEYSKFKHPDTLKTIVALDPTMFNSITSNTGVTQKRSEANFENYIQYINPFPSSVIANNATNITTTSFTANWDSVNKATGYKLYLDGSETPIVLGNVTSYDFTDLTGGTSHNYYIKAVNNAGESSNSNTISLILNPLAPTANSAINITTTSFTANWETVTGATSYTLFIDGVSSYTGTNLTYNKTGLSSASSHSYYVIATNASGNSANSNTINLTLNSSTPNTPVATLATNISQSSFTANWETVTGATSYTLYIDGVSSYTGTALTYNVTGLTAGTLHTYYVVSTGTGGNSPNSNTISVRLIPATPTANNATNITGTSFTANWTAVTGASSYSLYMDGNVLYKGASTSFNVTGLTVNTSYTYCVISENASGTMGVSYSIIVLTAPSAPTTSTATNITSTSFTANWTPVTGATSYKLKIDANSAIDVGNVTSYNASNLTAGATHYYYITATNSGGGNSANSNTTSVLLAPAIPRAHIASSLTQTSFIANWYAATGAASYTLYVDGVNVYNGIDTHFTKTGLVANTTHTYYITATNASGTSDASATVNVLTLPSAPTISTTDLKSLSVKINWTAITGATLYRLYNSYGQIYEGTNTTYTPTDLAPDTTYTYYVEAINVNGDASASNSTSVTTKGWLSCKVLKDWGNTSNGTYWINPDNSTSTADIPVYCNMTTDGGGWTMVVAQFETDPVTNWNEGIQADYDPSLSTKAGFALNSAQLPSDRSQVAFGANLDPTYIDFGNFVYTTGYIGKTLVYGQYYNYHIHRSPSGYYTNHDPENSVTGTSSVWLNTLTFDQTGGAKYTWAFAPNHTTAMQRGYALYGKQNDYADTAAWTVWVR